MLKVDVFSMAAAVPALLVAVSLLVAYAVNRKLTAFRWWAASFVLLAVALGTATLRTGAPPFWIKGPSWLCFYAAIALIAYGLYREGAARTNPMLRVVVCAVPLLAIIAGLTAIDAPPHLWVLLGPLPAVLFIIWSTVPILHARAWGHSLALLAGVGAIAVRAIWYATDIIRMGPPINSALRGALGPEGRLLPGPARPLLQGGQGPRLHAPPAVSEVTILRSIAGRIGGEEFAVVLSATELPTARLFAEAVRTGFSASDFSEDIRWRVTLSAGIARCEEGESLQAVMARADNALYAAKAQGRDQVVVAGGDPTEARARRLRAG